MITDYKRIPEIEMFLIELTSSSMTGKIVESAKYYLTNDIITIDSSGYLFISLLRNYLRDHEGFSFSFLHFLSNSMQGKEYAKIFFEPLRIMVRQMIG